MTQVSDPSYEIYQLAIESSPSGIMVVDSQGNIRYLNQTLAEMFEYSPEELIGKPVEILTPQQYATTHRNHVGNYTRNPEPRSMGSGRDLEGFTKNGRCFPVEIGLQPAQTESGQFIVVTVIDISERKAIEERLRYHEEQLEELVAERTRELHAAQQEKERVLDQLIQAEKMTAVGTLVSGIGHEINNPLYVLLAAAEAIGEEEDIARCRDYGREVLQQAKKIAETVKNLSSYARPGSGHDVEHVEISESLEEAVHLARGSLLVDQVDFRINAEPVPEIMAKPEEISQVLFNIIRNAIQAIDGRGWVDIALNQSGDRVQVVIADSGRGIEQDYLKRIFDPFFTTKGPDEGEGLGLYIVRQIITRYGGTINVENGDACGARFLIRFPAASRINSEEEKQ